MIKTAAEHTERPIVMALSNPTSKTEAHPRDVVNWCHGTALVATGSPFEPVRYHGRPVEVSQCNNVYIFPGVGLGALVSRAERVTDGMFTAASRALAGQVTEDDLEAGRLYPPIGELRAVSIGVARAVAEAAGADGVAPPMTGPEIEAALADAVWDLDYPKLLPA